MMPACAPGGWNSSSSCSSSRSKYLGGWRGSSSCSSSSSNSVRFNGSMTYIPLFVPRPVHMLFFPGGAVPVPVLVKKTRMVRKVSPSLVPKPRSPSRSTLAATTYFSCAASRHLKKAEECLFDQGTSSCRRGHSSQWDSLQYLEVRPVTKGFQSPPGAVFDRWGGLIEPPLKLVHQMDTVAMPGAPFVASCS